MIQILEDLLRSYNLEFGRQWEDHLPYIEFSYNNGHQTMISMTPYKALYGKKCQTPLWRDEVGERRLLGSKLVQMTIDKIKGIIERMK
jgi:hypothetical protein